MNARRSSSAAFCLATLVAVGVAGSRPRAQIEPVYPDETWETVSDLRAGVDTDVLDTAILTTGEGAGCIVRFGRLVRSWGDIEQRLHLKSTTKSIGGAALGLALADGLVELDAPASRYFPSLGVPPDENAATGWLDRITLRQLATHSSGFDRLGGFSALRFEPGTRWYYSDGGTNWLADCLTSVFQRDLFEVLHERVLAPIGVERIDLVWRRNAYRPEEMDGVWRRELGSGIGANANAMARVGYLYLRRGRWRDQQILPESFVDAVGLPDPTVAELPIDDDAFPTGSASRYGLLWWNNTDATLPDVPTDAYWAWGLGDSLIVVIPSLDLVISRAGDPLQSGWTPDYEVIGPFLTGVATAMHEPPPFFHRGDTDGNGALEITDAVAILGFLFLGSHGPTCMETADANNDSFVGVSDAISVLLYLFGGRASVAPPGPPGDECGVDPDESDSPADLGCAAYSGC